MTDHEIEKLREKLGPEYSVKRMNGAVTVELVDIWEGVEFAECVSGVKVNRYGKEIIKGNIYPIYEWFNREVIYIDKDELGWQLKHFKPSTEADYVDQLKAKANDLYGEIKNGDRFILPWIGNWRETTIRLKDEYDFHYDKETDVLDLHGFPLYKQGKWAKKVKEPIKANVYSYSEESDDHLTIKIKLNQRQVVPANPSEFLNHIEESIESYLNKSQ